MHRFQDSLAGCGDMPGLSINIDLDLPQLAGESGASSSLRTPQTPLANEFGETCYHEDPRRDPSKLTSNTGEYLPTLECVQIEDAPMCEAYELPDEYGYLSAFDGLNPYVAMSCAQIMDMFDKCDKTKMESKYEGKDKPEHEEESQPKKSAPYPPAHQGKSDKPSPFGKRDEEPEDKPKSNKPSSFDKKDEKPDDKSSPFGKKDEVEDKKENEDE